MPRDITPLVRTLEQSTPGSQDDVYQLLAAWNTSIEAALESGTGRAESVMQQYFEEVLSLTDAAATGTDSQIDWDFLAECCDAYPAGTGDHVCSSILVNVISRCVIRARHADDVTAIPPWALDHLSTISQVDGFGNKVEATMVGWGIGHPERSVADQIRDRAANGEQEWAAGALEHATVADSAAGIDLFERLVESDDIGKPLLFLTALEVMDDRSTPLLPEFWEPVDDCHWETDLSQTQWDRIRDVVGNEVSIATLRSASPEFELDLDRLADEAFERKLSEPIPESMLHIGKHQGGKWHLLGDACPDGDPDRVDTKEPFFECQYSITDPIFGDQIAFTPHTNQGTDMCRRCAKTISRWDKTRYNYAVTRDEEFDGGTLVAWTPLTDDRWTRACDICQKPAGASHTESTFDQAACPSCLRELSKPQGILRRNTDLDREQALTLDQILSGTVETRTLPPRDTLEQRAREQRRQHNRKREHLPLTHVGLTDNKVEILADHGYETVGDICEADPETLASISGLGRRWRPEHLPHTYTLSLTAFDGIGDTLAARLDDHGYGIIPALETASAEDLAQIQGMSISKAEQIFETLESW